MHIVGDGNWDKVEHQPQGEQVDQRRDAADEGVAEEPLDPVRAAIGQLVNQIERAIRQRHAGGVVTWPGARLDRTAAIGTSRDGGHWLRCPAAHDRLLYTAILSYLLRHVSSAPSRSYRRAASYDAENIVLLLRLGLHTANQGARSHADRTASHHRSNTL